MGAGALHLILIPSARFARVRVHSCQKPGDSYGSSGRDSSRHKVQYQTGLQSRPAAFCRSSHRDCQTLRLN
jgi:hypothetical protein